MPTLIARIARGAAVGAIAASGVAVAAPGGAAYTTDVYGTVNQNHYAYSVDVHLNGGPCTPAVPTAKLADGLYEFRVTDPPGKTTYSYGTALDRQFRVAGGRITWSSPGHPTVVTDASCGPIVRVGPFRTDSRTGEYKLWIAPAGSGFARNAAKTDNFRVEIGETPPGGGGGGGGGGEF